MSSRFWVWWRRWGTLCGLGFLWVGWWSSGWRRSGPEQRQEVLSPRRQAPSERRSLGRSPAAAGRRFSRRGLSAGPPRCWSPRSPDPPEPRTSSEPARCTERTNRPDRLETNTERKQMFKCRSSCPAHISTFRWIAMKCCADIHGPQRLNHTDFNDPQWSTSTGSIGTTSCADSRDDLSWRQMFSGCSDPLTFPLTPTWDCPDCSWFTTKCEWI